MGLDRGTIKFLMKIGKKREFSGLSVLTAGRLNIWATYKDVQKWSREMNFDIREDVQIVPSYNKDFFDRDYISDSTFFELLGFSKLDSIDFSNYQGGSILHDLNEDVPHSLHGRYDWIIDAGTSEHIFALPKVLENYNKTLKTGGRIIHFLPSTNHVDHGFYMFSPSLFFDYYSANKWEIECCYFVKKASLPFMNKRKLYEYVPGALGGYSRHLKGAWEVFFVAQKTARSTFDSPVQQGRYVGMWNASSKKDSATNETNNKTYLHKRISRLLPLSIKLLIYSYYMRFAPLPQRFIGRY